MIHLKIVQPGWVDYTGWIGPVYFENNLSTEPVTPRIARQISSCVRMEEVLAGGLTKPFGISQDMVAGKGLALPEPVLAIPADEADLLAEKERDAKAASLPKVSDFLTSAQLEAIADNQGIEGLRPIGAKWGVKDRSIPGLITKILAAQADHPEARGQAPAAADPDEIVEEDETTSPAPAVEAVAAAPLEAEEIQRVEVSAVPLSPALLVGEAATEQPKE